MRRENGQCREVNRHIFAVNVKAEKSPFFFPAAVRRVDGGKLLIGLRAGRLNLRAYFLPVPSVRELWLLRRLKYANTDAAARNKKSVYDDKMRGGEGGGLLSWGAYWMLVSRRGGKRGEARVRVGELQRVEGV